MNMLKIIAAKQIEDYSTPCGVPYREDFVGKLDKDTGEINLVSVGKTDLFELIQSYREETDIHVLMQRAENGDVTAFSSAVFGDFSQMPETYADALNIVIEAEREFDHLPVDIKEKFDNDFHKYIVSAGSNDWFEKLGVGSQSMPQFEKLGVGSRSVPQNDVVKESEVPADEQKQ